MKAHFQLHPPAEVLDDTPQVIAAYLGQAYAHAINELVRQARTRGLTVVWSTLRFEWLDSQFPQGHPAPVLWRWTVEMTEPQLVGPPAGRDRFA